MSGLPREHRRPVHPHVELCPSSAWLAKIRLPSGETSNDDMPFGLLWHAFSPWCECRVMRSGAGSRIRMRSPARVCVRVQSNGRGGGRCQDRCLSRLPRLRHRQGSGQQHAKADPGSSARRGREVQIGSHFRSSMAHAGQTIPATRGLRIETLPVVANREV